MRRFSFSLAKVLMILIGIGAFSLLQAQLSFHLIIDSATTQFVEGTLEVTNTATFTYSDTMPGMPWWGLACDGAVIPGGWFDVVTTFELDPGETAELPLSIMVDLTPGFHDFRGTWGTTNPLIVGNTVSYPVGFLSPQLSWLVSVNDVDPEGFNASVVVTNNSSATWEYNFLWDPYIRFNLDGQNLPVDLSPDGTDLILVPNESETLNFHYSTPLADGDHVLQAYLTLPPLMQTVNIGEPVNFVVDSTEELTIGLGDEIERLPLDFYWRNNLYECIYTISDLNGAAGWISGLGFYSHFETSSLPGPNDVRIFLGSTLQSDLSGGWIPATQMTLVYDGIIDFQTGQYLLRVDFPTSFLLPVDRNLVLLVEREFPSSYYTSAAMLFYSQSCAPNNARKHNSDAYDLDPYAPPTATAGQLIGMTPKITLFYTPAAVDVSDQEVPALPRPQLTNYPNPFNPETTIQFTLPQRSRTKLSVYDFRGREISVLVDNNLDAGTHRYTWNATSHTGAALGSGVYFLGLESCGESQTRRILLVK